MTVTILGSTAVLAATSGEGDAEGVPLYPDIIEEVPYHLQIQNTQQREFLRFSTTHINVGVGNLQIRGGGQVDVCVIDGETFEQCTIATQELLDAEGQIVATQPAGVALFHPEHNHWHQSGVAEFAIKPAGVDGARLDPRAGEDLVTGTKVTFCFVDVKFGCEDNDLDRSAREFRLRRRGAVRLRRQPLTDCHVLALAGRAITRRRDSAQSSYRNPSFNVT